MARKIGQCKSVEVFNQTNHEDVEIFFYKNPRSGRLKKFWLVDPPSGVVLESAISGDVLMIQVVTK